MTVRLLVDFKDPADGKQYVVGNLYTSAANEAGLIVTKQATSDLTGGTAWVDPVVPESIDETKGVNVVLDANGNTVLAGADGTEYATLGSKFITVGAGGRYSTLQAAINALATETFFVPVGTLTITAWNQGSDVATTSGSFPNIASTVGLWAGHPSSGGRLYPIETPRGSTNVVFGMRRIEANFSGTETLTVYRATPRQIYILPGYHDWSATEVTINTPMVLNIQGAAGATRVKYQYIKGAGFTHGVLNHADIIFDEASVVTNIAPGLWTATNTVEITLDRCVINGVNDGFFSPGAKVGNATMNQCTLLHTPGVPLGHCVVLDAQGDVVINGCLFKIFAQNVAVADFRVIDQTTARNIICTGNSFICYDSNGAMNKLALLAQCLSDSYASGNTLTYMTPGASSCELAVAHDDMDATTDGAGKVILANNTINASSGHTGGKFQFKANKVGSTNTVKFDGRGNGVVQKPSAGTLTVETTQSIAYAASITPDAGVAENIIVGTLAGNITINAPLNPTTGRIITFGYTANGTAGWAITYNAVFKTSAVPTSTANGTATHVFQYNGTNWVQVGGALVWL